MHVKITTSGSRRYVQLVESYRDDAGKEPLANNLNFSCGKYSLAAWKQTY